MRLTTTVYNNNFEFKNGTNAATEYMHSVNRDLTKV